MISDDHDTALSRNIVPLAVSNAVAEIKVIKDPVNKVQATITLVIAQKLVDLLFAREFAQQVQRSFSDQRCLGSNAGTSVGYRYFDLEHDDKTVDLAA